jgi:uncharacterized membrane protein
MNSTAISASDGNAAALSGGRDDTRRTHSISAWTLRAAATFWVVVTILGQLVFVAYIGLFYGRAAAQGQPELWNKVLQAGYASGATFNNAVLATHLLLAFVITAGGLLQLVPMIRRRWPRLHRWNGRVYLTGAVGASVAGLIMIWTRDTGGDLSQHLAISLSALLIFAFAGLALRHARARQFDIHRRWALRLFLVVSGGWFFRVGLMFWIVLNQGPVGFDPKTFTGPFITFLSFAEYLLPLAVLELYFRAQRGHDWRARLAVAAGLFVLTLAMSAGIAAASAIMWLPHMR